MACTVVVGGQFGSEGKGKVAAFLARQHVAPWAVRCGGPNAGHSLNWRGETVILRHIPAGISNLDSTLVLCAGSVINESILLDEIESLEIASERLIIDPMAAIIQDSDIRREKRFLQHVSSTFSGTGWATMARVGRPAVCDWQQIRCY
jgi:adenylosuccinate synthase